VNNIHTHNHLCDEHQHSCENTHEHHKEELFGELQEIPTVFSWSKSFDFNTEVSGYELREGLVEWIEDLKKWVLQNKYFIGHIKIFVEGGKNFNFWISTTGKKINVKGSSDELVSNIKNITINITVIIFGPDEQTLRSITLENLYRKLPSFAK
jgi:hypothetical protein